MIPLTTVSIPWEAERIQQQYGLKPQRLIGDTGKGTAQLLGWMVEQGIEPHVPVWDRTKREDVTLLQQRLLLGRTGQRVPLPAGQAPAQPMAHIQDRAHARHTGRHDHPPIEQARLRELSHEAAPLPEHPVRKIARSVHEAARDVARQIATTGQYPRSRCERKKVEMLFVHLKTSLGLDRLRLRGLSGASDEFTLAATVQNLRRLAMLALQGPPVQGIGAPA